MKRILIILLVTMVVFAGCISRKVDRKDMVGKYLANHNKGLDSLILEDNGTFRSYYQRNVNTKLYADTGLWSFDVDGLDQYIAFHDVSMNISIPGDLLLKGGNVILPIEANYLNSKIKISLGADYGYYYIKQ